MAAAQTDIDSANFSANIVAIISYSVGSSLTSDATTNDTGGEAVKPLVITRPSKAPEPQYYSVSQTAKIFGISPVSLYRAINAGEFPAVRIRNRVFVPMRAVREMTDAAVATQSVVDAAEFVPEGAA